MVCFTDQSLTKPSNHKENYMRKRIKSKTQRSRREYFRLKRKNSKEQTE